MKENRETWIARLWLDELAMELAEDAGNVKELAEMLKSYVYDDMYQTMDPSGFLENLLTYALDCVDWRSIAEGAME